jgi:hypothetical protein
MARRIFGNTEENSGDENSRAENSGAKKEAEKEPETIQELIQYWKGYVNVPFQKELPKLKIPDVRKEKEFVKNLFQLQKNFPFKFKFK